MKRQQQHSAGVVAVQPAALPLTGAEGEKVLENLLVDNDATDDGHQHGHGRQPHYPDAKVSAHVQGVMEAKEETAARGVARLDQFASGRIQIGALTAPLLTGRNA